MAPGEESALSYEVESHDDGSVTSCPELSHFHPISPTPRYRHVTGYYPNEHETA